MIFSSLDDSKLVEMIIEGKIGVLPTDTIYGLVCDAKNAESVDKLYRLKGRNNKPGTVIAANTDQLIDIGLKRRYIKSVEQYWPGSISVKIPSSIEYLELGVGDVACRVIKDGKLQKLLLQTGALQTTSVNMTGKPPATSIEAAQEIFGDSVDFYVDGGYLKKQEPSTIIRVIDDAIEVVREGAVKIDEETGRIIG